MASWRFVLTDNKYKPVGEIINASDRKIALPLSKLDTMSFKMRLDNPLADPILTTAGYIKAYRDGALRFFGPIVSAEESVDAENASVSVNAVGAGWIFQKRLVAKPVVAGQPVIIVPADRTAIFQYWMGVSDTENNIPIAVDGSNSAASTSAYDPGINAYKPLYEVLTDLSVGTAGFDWRILPNENYVSGAVTSSDIGVFYARPVIGSLKGNASFEWGVGTRNNLTGYTRTVTRDTQANKVYHLASQGGTSAQYPPISALDVGSINDFGLLEDLAQADLLDTTMRTTLVQEHVAVRSQPRQIVQMTPHIDPGTGRVPSYGTDYDVGDFVPLRATYNGQLRINTTVRIWGITFDIDNNGMERASTVLAEE